MKNKIEPIFIEVHYSPRFSPEQKVFVKCVINPAKMWVLFDALSAIESTIDVWDGEGRKMIIKSGKELKNEK